MKGQTNPVAEIISWFPLPFVGWGIMILFEKFGVRVRKKNTKFAYHGMIAMISICVAFAWFLFSL